MNGSKLGTICFNFLRNYQHRRRLLRPFERAPFFSWNINSSFGISNLSFDDGRKVLSVGISSRAVQARTLPVASTNINSASNGNNGEDLQKNEKSNRAKFKATPIIPSILSHIEKIGVGIRPKQTKRRRRQRSAGGKSGDKNISKRNRIRTLDETEEIEYFSNAERQHRQRWRSMRNNTSKDGRRNSSVSKGLKSPAGGGERITDADDQSSRGAFWLPPPPFSSYSRGTVNAKENVADGQEIIRRPVKMLGKAGSLQEILPLASKGLSEIALAGRSNVGKSTLLNALLYGNIDENLPPNKFQRGKTPIGAKLPKGIKATTSDKPGETKELTFYQLTADVVSHREVGSDIKDGDENKIEKGKMSLLLVDLPGYGFAFAKYEKTKEWQELMHHYLLERRSLKRILLLIDARHGFKLADFEFLQSLQDGLKTKITEGKTTKRELPPIQIVLTKCDLVTQSDLARRVVIVRRQLSEFLIREPSTLPVMLVSARAGLGFNNVRGEHSFGGVLQLQRELASLVPKPRVHPKRVTK